MSKILVVDDDKIIQEVIRETLQQNGHIVTLVDNGKDAREFLSVNTYDLVILDLHMPKLNGVALLGWLRMFSQMKVIVITAYGDSIETEKVQNMIVSDLLVKPFALSSLEASVKTVLTSP